MSIEKIFAAYGFTLVPTGDCFGTLRLHKDGKPLNATAGSAIEFAERYLVTFPQGELSDKLRTALCKHDSKPFEWNAQAMIN